MPHFHLRGFGAPRFMLVVLILASGLVACAEPIIQVGSEASPSPTSTVASLGRLVDGEQSADLALVGTSNDLWNLQAVVSFPDAASVDSVTLYTTRSDLPGAEQYVVQHILDGSPAILDLTLPHLADGQRVYAQIDLQIDAEAHSLGHVQLEAAAGRWHVVELVSAEIGRRFVRRRKR